MFFFCHKLSKLLNVCDNPQLFDFIRMVRKRCKKQHYYMGGFEVKRDFHVPFCYVLFQHPVALLDITRDIVLIATAQKIDQITA
jgi:hypothetical protein